MNTHTQCGAVLQFIKEFGGISSMQAFGYLRITRLSARIYDLKKKGYKIKTEIRHTSNCIGNDCSYAYYTLEEGEQA